MNATVKRRLNERMIFCDFVDSTQLLSQSSRSIPGDRNDSDNDNDEVKNGEGLAGLCTYRRS